MVHVINGGASLITNAFELEFIGDESQNVGMHTVVTDSLAGRSSRLEPPPGVSRRHVLYSNICPAWIFEEKLVYGSSAMSSVVLRVCPQCIQALLSIRGALVSSAICTVPALVGRHRAARSRVYNIRLVCRNQDVVCPVQFYFTAF